MNARLLQDYRETQLFNQTGKGWREEQEGEKVFFFLKFELSLSAFEAGLAARAAWSKRKRGRRAIAMQQRGELPRNFKTRFISRLWDNHVLSVLPDTGKMPSFDSSVVSACVVCCIVVPLQCLVFSIAA